MSNQITTFPHQLGWQGRERGFNLLNKLFEEKDTEYAIFLHKETEKFENGYNQLNTKKEYIYVCKGDLKKLLNDLDIHKFSTNELFDSKSSTLKLKLIQKHFQKSIIRQPVSRLVEGEFYQLTAAQFDSMPFTNEPITKQRDIFMATKLYDRLEINKELKVYIRKHLTPIKTNKDLNYTLFYTPIIKDRVERYVPNKVNQKAFELAIKHSLDLIEFNFLNFFYETKKAMRNDNGQLFFDINTHGIGWYHDRNWVKKKMKRLIDLELVKFESRHDCRDRKYTSWYFYDADKNLDDLKHDF